MSTGSRTLGAAASAFEGYNQLIVRLASCSTTYIWPSARVVLGRKQVLHSAESKCCTWPKASVVLGRKQVLHLAESKCCTWPKASVALGRVQWRFLTRLYTARNSTSFRMYVRMYFYKTLQNSRFAYILIMCLRYILSGLQ